MNSYSERPWDKKSPDEVISSGKGNFKFNFPNKLPFTYIALIIFALMILKGSFYTIQANEVGVILRFGKFISITKPGLHFKIPLGIESVYPVKIDYNYKEEFGFRTLSAGVRTQYDKSSYNSESIMLTGDLNVLNVEWIIQYKIKDPYSALFRIRNLKKTLRDISESVMRKIVGDSSFNDALTVKRPQINLEAQKNLQEILDSYNVGVHIVTVKLQDVNPPDQVKPAFNEVNEAKQEREKMINQAWQTYNQKIPQAKGQAQKIIKEAEGYALAKINVAEGDSKRFTLLRDAYVKAKDITLKRLYLENMRDVLKQAGKKYIIDPEEKGILPLMSIK